MIPRPKIMSDAFSKNMGEYVGSDADMNQRGFYLFKILMFNSLEEAERMASKFQNSRKEIVDVTINKKGNKYELKEWIAEND